MSYDELAAEYRRMQYSHQVTADELAKATVRIARLEKAARDVFECEGDLEDAILALRSVVVNRS